MEGSGSNGKRATVHDVARQAGVSLATVDRVLNGRPGVRPQTAEKVEAAIRALDFRRDLSASLLARARDLSRRLPPPRGRQRVHAEPHRGDRAARPHGPARAADASNVIAYRALDADALAARLDALDARAYDCAVVVATEDAAGAGRDRRAPPGAASR